MSHGQSKAITLNAIWAASGNMIFAIGRMLILMLLAKNYYSDSVGQVFFALAVVTPINYLVNMESRSVYVTDPRGMISFGSCMATRLMTNGLFILVIAIVCIVFRRWGGYQCMLIILAAGVRLAESWADLFLAVLQKSEQMKLWAISQITKTIGVLLGVLLLPLVSGQIHWMLIVWIVVTVLVVFLYDRRQAGRFAEMAWDFTGCIRRQLIKKAMPLGVFTAISILNQQIAQYYLKIHMDDSANAYWGVLFGVVAGACAVQNGVNQALLPRLAKYYAESRRQFSLLLGKLLVISWLGMLIMVFIVYKWGPDILMILTSDEYARQQHLFIQVVYTGCILLTAMILGDAVIACHCFKSRVLAVALGLAVNIIICHRYIPTDGLAAGVWATIASQSMTLLVCIIVIVMALIKPAKS